MEKKQANTYADLLNHREAEILADWISLQLSASTRRADLMNEVDLRKESREFMAGFRQAVASGSDDTSSPAWKDVRDMLEEISSSRARMGFSPSETAMFVFSLKQPLFRALQKGFGDNEAGIEFWKLATLLDRLGLLTTELYQKTRETLIKRQQRELLELSTPVVKLWDSILALPLIGTLDSERTQIVMESLLQTIVETGAALAIIDITGVPTVDTLVAQHLLKTVAAARLMGAECIISGIRPQIAATIVHLGVDLNSVATKATLADAFALALRRTGQAIQKVRPVHPQETRVGTNSDS
jgi:rsbT co-antagonist protein RsbR